MTLNNIYTYLLLHIAMGRIHMVKSYPPAPQNVMLIRNRVIADIIR